jgi:hypothetical protein
MWSDFYSPTVSYNDFGLIYYNNWEDTVSIEPTYLVDSNGGVYVEGWNPNNFFKDRDLTINIKERDRKIIGKKYFDHWEFPWIQIYKNQYEDTYFDSRISITLEEFYHNVKYLKLKKDQFLSWNSSMYGDRYFKRIPTLSYFEHMRLDYIGSLETDKHKLIDRWNTILRSKMYVKKNYVRIRVLDKIKTTHKEFEKMSDVEVHNLLGRYFNDEVEKLNEVHNLQKFMK